MDYKLNSAIVILENTINHKKEEVGKSFNPDNYILMIPQTVYEVLLDYWVPEEEEGLFELYYNKVRIMFNTKDSRIFMVTKDEYNKVYNPCNFVTIV